MTNRAVLATSLALGLAGIAAAILTWVGIADWQHTPSLATVLLFGALAGLGWVILDSIRSIRKDLILVRDRSKSLVENAARVSERTEEVRRELFLGPYAHVPGQIARLEGALERTDTPRPARSPLTVDPVTPFTVFDAVFVLNLDRDTEKMRQTTELLGRYGIAFTRFPAVDGDDPEFDDEWAAYMAEGPQLPPEHYTGERLIESRGAWGYLKSMRALLEHAQSQRLQNFLLLEDDVMFHNAFASRFAETWTELPDDWKVVYLGSAQVDRSKITRYADHLYHPGAMANGSYAIALDASIYDQALASIARFDWPFDAGALREIDAAFPTNVFVVDPPLVIADVSESDIRPGRGLEAHADKHGWDLADYHKPMGQP